MNKLLYILFIILSFVSCTSKRVNHITYLNKVNEIDSVYRIQKDTLNALKMYQKLFKKHAPHNSYLINEYQTYVVLSDKYHQKMEKKTLYKLIPLLAPNWKYNREDRTIIALYGRYGIDSLEIESEVKEWKKNLNKKLIDSFSVATFRDSEGGRGNRELILKNDKKNEQLLIWTLKNYGYPSLQKIGLWSNNDEPMSIGTILNHMASYDTYPYFKKELLKYVESGECTPLDYAMMVDKFDMIKGRDCTYCTFKNIPVSDSLKVNINRRKIGMPSLNHSKKIHNDYFKR